MLRWSATLALTLLPALPVHGRTLHSDDWARDRFAAAERMREALNGRPARERTRHEYQKSINAYRAVYFGAPRSSKADPSVVATAELMVEMGRTFNDDKILRSAIDQYRFLRKEYPGSKFRFDALFTMGEVYKDDLDDATQAKETFEEFLRRYPRNHLADDAQQALDELSQQAAKREKKNAAKPEKSTRARETDDTDARQVPPRGKPRVTGIRHWSTPDYTRVAIDLEQDIKFESQRIDNPDRIFFDLRDTKLASTLVGKTFEVDDGLLKKIRVAQFQPGRIRVVLEVEDLSDYSAFLLPNPSRLIIDIHGRQTRQFAKQGDSDVKSKASDQAETKTQPSAGSQIEDAADLKDVKAAAKIDAVSKPSKKSGEAEIPQEKTRTVFAKSASGKSIPKTIVEAEDDDPEAGDGVPVVKTTDAKSEVPPVRQLETASTPSVKVTPDHALPTKGAGKKKKTSKSSDELAGLDIREARPTANGDRSLIRALGLKIGKIVIDPGHGGHDTGTIGPNGLLEKDLVLEVAHRLGRLLDQRLGAEVVYTRQDDTFIPLETRTAIANRERADLFISIHANSSHDPAARGVETYYLNFSSSAEALEVAARENAVSEKSIYELQDLVKKIALKEKIEESREFASNVQQALHSGLSTRSSGMRDRGVKKAPFIVLIGANMPSILAEVSFVSNPSDERKLETGEYRQRIADSLYRGISKYASGLSGIKVASRMVKAEGQ
jgi:N-acetylmuramoyl-L-alanine amidase